MRHHNEAMDPGRRTNQLRSMPVVVVSSDDLAEVVEAGAARAGGSPTFVVVPHADEATLLAALETGAEIVIAVCVGQIAVQALSCAESLGGRGIPSLTVEGEEVAPSTFELLADPSLRDLNVPVPLLEEEARAVVWDSLRAARVEERHHLVEVDGQPALDELIERGTATAGDEVQLLAAGAAGVLAGRMASANRKWRAQLS
jgi:hypothetical protein